MKLNRRETLLAPAPAAGTPAMAQETEAPLDILDGVIDRWIAARKAT